MERIGDSLSNFARDDGLRLVLIILGTVIAVRLVRIFLYRLQRRVEKSRLAVRGAGEAGRLTALFDVLHYLGVAVVVGIGAMSVLAVLGVNTGALLASAGVLGFAVGFGAQTMVKDLLNGLFLLAEGQYTIGDEITISGVTGIVERVTLRTTTLRATNGDVHIVPSGDIRLVTNRSRGWGRVLVDVPVPGTVPMSRAMDVLERCVEALRDDDTLARDLLDTPEVLGIEDARDDYVLIRIAAKVNPGRRLAVARLVRRRVFDCFEAEGLAPPVPPAPSARSV